MTWDLWLYALPATALLLVWGCGEDGPGGSRSYDPRSRDQSRNNLKQIGIALHNYHDTHSTFPPGGIYSVNKTPQHSWQSMLLPFIEQQQLHSALDFTRPWTDPKNAPVFTNQVPVYQILAHQFETTDGQGRALSHYAGNSHVFKKNRGLKFRDFTDGTSNTTLAGEVSTGFKPWGDPGNVRDPGRGIGKSADQFLGPHGDQTFFLRADGSVKTVNNNVDPQILREFATPAGNETPRGF